MEPSNVEYLRSYRSDLLNNCEDELSFNGTIGVSYNCISTPQEVEKLKCMDSILWASRYLFTYAFSPVLHAKNAMWSRKESVCSAVSGASRGDDEPLGAGIKIYPFAIALRVRVLQIVCGIGGVVVGAVGWLEERQKPALGLGVPAGAITVIAATTSVYYSRGFGGWVSARTRSPNTWGVPWRALGPSPCAAVPLTLLWTAAVAAHVAMLCFCVRSLMNIGCGSSTCIGVAGAQLSVSVTTLAAAVFMLQLDLRYDASLSPPPRQSDAQICTAVSMVPLTSVAINSGNSGDDPGGSPSEKNPQPQPPI